MMKKAKVLINLFFLLILLCLGLWSAKIYSNAKQVLAFRPLIREILAENQLTLEEDLVLAIIYTESKGKGADIMQASESVTGQQATISNQRDSVIQGTQFLQQNLALSAQTRTDFWTGVQAYNFGSNYIDYVASQGQVSSVELARTYSRQVVAPSLGNSDGLTYQFYHPLAIFYGSPYLYQNGGNYYYAKQVMINRRLIQLVALIEE